MGLLPRTALRVVESPSQQRAPWQLGLGLGFGLGFGLRFWFRLWLDYGRSDDLIVER